MRVVVLVCVLAGCQPEPQSSCAAFAEAASACAISHGADAEAYDLAVACATWDEAHEEYYGAYYECRAAAYSSRDCATDAGYEAARTSEACCAPPGAGASADSACAD